MEALFAQSLVEANKRQRLVCVPYNQLNAFLLDPSSSIAKDEPSAVLLLFRVEDLVRLELAEAAQDKSAADECVRAFRERNEQFLDVLKGMSRLRLTNFAQAHPVVKDTLEPGEMVLVPAGWFHHFNSVTDSISLTWNFVHNCRLREFVSHLVKGPGETEMKQLTYAYLRK